MSAFIVSEANINLVVDAIDSYFGNRRDYIFGPVTVRNWTEDYRDLDALGQALWAMNVDAWNQRYNETETADAFHYKLGNLKSYRATLADRVQAYKATQCLRYQCHEGNVPESDLYKALSDFLSDYGASIINEISSSPNLNPRPRRGWV